MGTFQEQVEGKGPPFYMDMRHFSEEDAHHLQYVLMPADKETYLDYCKARNIDFKKTLLEVEIGELSLSGMLVCDDRMETAVKGLFAGCNFTSFSGAICGGFVAGLHASTDAPKAGMGELDEKSILARRRVSWPAYPALVTYSLVPRFENPIRQVMDYYAKYRRNMPGMTLALERLALVESYKGRVYAKNLHELMRLHEGFDLLSQFRYTCTLPAAKGKRRAMYELSDFPKLNPDLAKGLVVQKKNGAPVYSWGL